MREMPPPLASEVRFTFSKSHDTTHVRLSSAPPPVDQSLARGADILLLITDVAGAPLQQGVEGRHLQGTGSPYPLVELLSSRPPARSHHDVDVLLVRKKESLLA